MPSLTIGSGVKNVAYFIMLTVIAATFFYFGQSKVTGELKESNLEVVANDSKIALKIRTKTDKVQENLNEKLDNLKHPIITDGYVSAEFMQLIRSEKSNAELRGNQTGIIRTITKGEWEWPGEE